MDIHFLDNLLKLLNLAPTTNLFNVGGGQDPGPIVNFLANRDFFQFADGFISGDRIANIGGF